MRGKTLYDWVTREALTFSRHVLLTWGFLGIAYAILIIPEDHIPAWLALPLASWRHEQFVFPLASWGGMVWLTIAAMIIHRFGKNRFDMAVAAEAIYSLGIISILLATSIGAVRMLEDSANFSIIAFVEGLPKVKWLFAESVLGIGLSNGLSTIVRIFEVEFSRDGKERLGSGGTLYGDDIGMSKITSEVRTLGEVLAQVQTKAKSLEDNLESVNQRVSDFASKFFEAQKNLEEFTSASAQMTEEMRNTFTLWKNIATLLVSFDGFRLRKE